MRRSSVILGFAIFFLICIATIVWLAVVAESRGKELTVSFLDIGQGDAIFIDAPSGVQVLIDGGPGRSVLRQLSREMPWYDRSIDVLIATHPDNDHTGGLIDVLERYNVSSVLQSSVLGDTSTFDALQKTVFLKQKQGMNVVTAQRGQIVDLGEGAFLEILFPDRSVPAIETNTGCVVTRLVYRETSFMFPCDAPKSIEKYLVYLDGGKLQSDVLKAAHHGSKTSSTLMFVGFVSPQYAVYSRGCDNPYGHPHKETIATYAQFDIPTLDTCEEGTVTFISDGRTVVLK